MSSEPARAPLATPVEYPRVYRLRVVALLFAYTAAVALAAGGIAIAWLLSRPAQPDKLLCAICSPLLLLGGVALAVYVWRYRVLLEVDAITVASAFGQRRLARGDIAGRRTLVEPRSHVVTTRLVPNSPAHKRIELSSGLLVTDAVYFAWIEQLLDLDAEDLQRAEAVLVAELGGDDRAEAKLERARTLTKLLNPAGFLLAAWAFTKPQPYALVVGALAAAPWLALAVAALSKGVIRLDKKRNSPHPHVAFLFLMPTLALGLRAVFDLTLTSPVQLVLPAAVAAAPMMAVWLWIERSSAPLERLMAFVFVFAYAAAAVAMADVTLDHSPPDVHHARVTSKRMSQGDRTTEYHLALDWLPGGREDTSVARGVYDAVEVGSAMAVVVHPGALRLEWFYVRPE